MSHTKDLADALFGDCHNGLQSSRLYALKDLLAVCKEKDVWELIAADDPYSMAETLKGLEDMVRDCEIVLTRDGHLTN